MRADLKLAGGEALLPSGLATVDLLIAHGRIAAIAAPGFTEATEAVDVTGLTLLPGAVDAHVHLGHNADIARPRVSQDAATETAAAALGGVTTIVPYIMSAEPHLPAFDEIVAVIEAGARIDFGLHFVIATEEQLAEVSGLVARGAPTAKLFMNIRGDEGARLGLPGTDDGFLLHLLEQLATHGGMLCPHPENIELAWVLRRRVTEADPNGAAGLVAWNDTRPPLVEAEALMRACYLARMVGAPVHAVHTSSAEALDAALAQRRAGTNVSIETCLHYLTHDVGCGLGAMAKVNPPLRAPSDREALWAAVARGDIDTVGTDHIHRPLSSKDGGIWQAQPGFPGLDVFLPALLTEGLARGVPLARLMEMASDAPARRMGLEAKGMLVPGADADIAVVDLKAPFTVERDGLATDANYSIFEGRRMACSLVHTLSHGRFVLRDGAFVDDGVGKGRYVPRRLVHPD
ncbi:dihydroorotase [Acuticoccus sp.]|uniref:dihydroorotase n=1 Tax=Acuticoccus sp. TaxID=1904378 RepID=UPI003B5212F7